MTLKNYVNIERMRHTLLFLFCALIFLQASHDAHGFCGVSVETLEVTSITENSATLEGRFNGSIGSCDVINISGFFEYGEQSGVYSATCNSGNGGVGDFSCNISGLDPNTQYYYIAGIHALVDDTNTPEIVYVSGDFNGGDEHSFFTSTSGNGGNTTPITDNNTINLTINENLTLSCNGDITIDEGTPGLTAGTPESQSSQCTVTTNDEDGYDFSVVNDLGSGNVLRNGSYSIPDYISTIDVPTSYTGEGLGFSIYSAPQKESKWGTGNSCHDTDNNYAAFPDINTTITSNTEYAHDSTDINICYRINVLSTQASGHYTGSVTYTATGAI